ncbi:MAG: DNA polymerase I [Alphaproteobacteria bacterium]|nr:DNA polymerase I [Alphaproteobacteria bacterium]
MPEVRASARSAHPPRGRLYLVDGSGYIFRAYHGLPPLTKKDGTPTGAVYGFCSMLAKLIDDVAAEGGAGGIAVIFDAARKNFRTDIYKDYKAHRPPPPDDLIPQFGLIREATRAFDLPCIEQEGYEADDLIATYARLARDAGIEVTIVSGDKDLMQLVRPGVAMFDPMKARRIGEAEVVERFGVGPDKVVDVQALTGDSVDNVPGVPGIGVKTAAELIREYGDLDALLARAGEIKQPKRRETLVANAEKAQLSRELVRLKDDVPVETAVEELGFRPPKPDQLFAFLTELEFTKLVDRLKGKLGAGTGVAPAPAARAPARAKGPAAEAYELVTEPDALTAWVARARHEGRVALSVLRTPEPAMRSELVGVALAVRPGEACYIPLVHAGAGALALDARSAAPGLIARDRALALLKPLCADVGVLKIGRDIKEDAVLLGRAGLELSPVDDVGLIAHVLESGLGGREREALFARHLERTVKPWKDVIGSGKGQLGPAQVPLDRALAYMAEGADCMLRLHDALKPKLVVERLVAVYETLERPLIPVLAAMETAGIQVDPETLKDLSHDFARRAAELETEIHRLAKHAFNIGSPKQLGEVLFDELKLPGGKKGKTGAYGTGADILEELAADGHKLPARVLDWRQLTKLKSTYTDALQAEINPTTGRVHTTYDQAGAATGRLASNDPNLQNIPIRTEEGRKIRRAFVPERGHVLVSADYSQIELRLLAHIADIGALKSAFAEGVDIHALTASQVFGVPLKGMDPAVRRNAKAINFGIIYGMSAFGLARQLGIPREEANAYIKAYFARYPGIHAYMDATKTFCRERGYVETIFGRRCYIAGIKDKNAMVRNFSERAAINAPIQGSAADIIKRAMIRIPDALAGAKLKARMLLTVHDELLFEAPAAEVETLKPLVKKTMEAVAHLSVPLTADVGAGANWDEAH